MASNRGCNSFSKSIQHNGLNLKNTVRGPMITKLEALDGKRLQELDHIMIQKNKVARAYARLTTSGSKRRVLKKGSSFGR